MLCAIACSLLEQVAWRKLQLAGLLRLHQMVRQWILAVDGGLLVALGLHGILCTRQVLWVLEHARNTCWLPLSTTEDYLLGGLGTDLGRDVLAHRVRIEGLRLLVLSEQVHALVVLLDTEVLEVGVLDGGLATADGRLRLLDFLAIDDQIGRLQLGIVAKALDLLDVAHIGKLLLRPVAVVLCNVLLLVEEVLELSLLHQLLLLQILLTLHRRLILDGLWVLIISDHLHVHAHLLLLLLAE